MTESTNYLAYLVRLWREGDDKTWRATVKNPHTGEQQSFATLPQLLAFLEKQTGEGWVVVEKEDVT